MLTSGRFFPRNKLSSILAPVYEIQHHCRAENELMLPSCFEGRSGRVVEKINTAVYQVISFHFIELTVKNSEYVFYVEVCGRGKARQGG